MVGGDNRKHTYAAPVERRFFARGAALIVLVAFGGFARNLLLRNSRSTRRR
jgi:hypothetical protein